MRFPEVTECKICGKKREEDKYFHPGTKLCNSCFQKERRKPDFQRWKKDENLKCIQCGTLRKDTCYFNIEHCLCNKCYMAKKRREKNIPEKTKNMNLRCKICGETRKPNVKFYPTLSLCKKCYMKQWKDKHPDYFTEWERNRKSTDEVYRFARATQKTIRYGFKRKGFNKVGKTEEILGCSYDEFRKYIKSKFKEGMTFNNYGEWELDHIIPISSASTIDEVKKLNHYTNFQPLWKEENRRKGSKI